jgi:hypothetical protein
MVSRMEREEGEASRCTLLQSTLNRRCCNPLGAHIEEGTSRHGGRREQWLNEGVEFGGGKALHNPTPFR